MKRNIFKLLAKWVFLTFPILLIASIFHSCGVDDKVSEIPIGYIPVQLEKDGAWSFMARDGKIMFENVFKHEPTKVVSGLFSVEEEKGYALYSIEGEKYKLVNGLNNLAFVGSPNCGVIPICRAGERLSVVNLQGEHQFELSPVDGKEIISCGYHFEDDMLGVMDENNKFGFYDKSGKCAIAPSYDVTGAFSDGKALVEKDSVWSVIDKTGELLFSLKDGQIPVCDWKYKHNRLIARDADGHQFYVYNENGDVEKLPEFVYAVHDFNDEYIIYSTGEDGQWGLWSVNEKRGLLTFAGENVISPGYKFLSFGDDNLMLASRDGKDWELLQNYSDMKNQIDIDYNNVQYIQGFGYVAQEYRYGGHDADEMVVLNKDGKEFTREKPFKTFGENWWSGVDKSQYIPTERIVNTISSMISTSGVGEYAFGMEINEKMQSMRAGGDKTGLVRIPIFSVGDNIIWGLIFEHSNKIDWFKVFVETPICYGKKGGEDIVLGLKREGFQEVAHEDRPEAMMYILEKEGCQVLIEHELDDNLISLNVYNNKFTKKDIDQMCRMFYDLIYDEDGTIHT